MVSQITQGIKITVKNRFEGSYFIDNSLKFAFSYEITIENHSKDTVQLLRRHWEIKDALNNDLWVDGEGVIGEKPIIIPGEQVQYTSGCMLVAAFGSMKGFYVMQNIEDESTFQVYIPTFHLCAPFALN